MATSKGDMQGEMMQVCDDDDRNRHKLTSRQETSRRLPPSDNLDMTTVTELDSRQVTASSRPPITGPDEQLPTLTTSTSSDHVWSNVPPVTDEDRSSVKSANSRQSSAAIPARLPALDVRQSSKDDLKTDVETNKQAAVDRLGSVESIKMEGGSQSGKLVDVDGAAAWTQEKPDDIAVDDQEEEEVDRTLDFTPADTLHDDHNDDRHVEKTDAEEADDAFSSIHTDDKATSKKEPESHHDETFAVTTSEVTKTNTDDATRNCNVHASGNTQTVDSSAGNQFNASSHGEVETQAINVEVRLTEEQTQLPGENDSGVNVDDVHSDEPATTTTDTQPQDTKSSSHNDDGHLFYVTPPSDDLTASTLQIRTKQRPTPAHSDDNRLAVRKSPSYTDLTRRRNSALEAQRDSKQLRNSDEALAHSADLDKPRLLALAQKGEWSVLDQILRAMDRSSFHEINLADQVCITVFNTHRVPETKRKYKYFVNNFNLDIFRNICHASSR